jgi:hypothetical protein
MFCLFDSPLPTKLILISTYIPHLAKIKLKNRPKGIRTCSSKYARSYHYTTCVYVYIYYSKNIYYISPEAHLLPLHNA